MNDHCLYQHVCDIKQIMQKFDEAFASIESCVAEYIYEVQREREQIASYSLQPPQISLHPHHHHVKVPQSKVHPGSTVPALPRSLPAIAKKCHNQHPRFSRLRQSRQHRCIFASRLAPHDLVCDQESKNKICGNTYYISIQIKPI
jgi:hypothetical protein